MVRHVLLGTVAPPLVWLGASVLPPPPSPSRRTSPVPDVGAHVPAVRRRVHVGVDHIPLRGARHRDDRARTVARAAVRQKMTAADYRRLIPDARYHTTATLVRSSASRTPS